MKRVTFKAGDHLYSQGDKATKAYLLLEGEVAFFLGSKRVFDVSREAFFGDLHLFDEGDYPATAVAATDAIALSFTKDQLLDYLMDSREPLTKYLGYLGSRLEEIVLLHESRE